MSKKILTLLLLTLALFLGCGGGGGQQAKNDGSGSEIVGVVQTDETRTARAADPVPDALIFLFDRNYLAVGGEDPETLSDDEGRFSIPNTPQGSYFIEAFDNSTENPLSKIRRVIVTGEEDVVNAGAMNLELPATVKCRIKLPDQIALLGSLKYSIYVVGTRVHSTGDENNMVIDLGDIPTGEKLTIKAVLHKPVPLSASQEVDLTPGLSVVVELNDWL